MELVYSTNRKATYHREREARDPAYKAYRRRLAKETQARRRELLRSALATYKLDQGCADCGDKWQALQGEHPEGLEFDHPNGHQRKQGRSRLGNAGSWSALLDELDRVEVVCAVCHNFRTKERLDATG